MRRVFTRKVAIVSLAVFFSIYSALSPVTVSAQSASSVNCNEYYDFISLNDDRGFYNPCITSSCGVGGGSLSGPAPTQLRGEDDAEKVWNYFIERGLSPIAAAGAMGNIEKESGFNPWAGEYGSTTIDKNVDSVGFGLIQWTNRGSSMRRQKVMQYLEDNGVKLDATDLSQKDSALLYELHFLWDVESGMTWQEPLNAETTVEGNTAIASHNAAFSSSLADSQVGNGSTLLFHTLIERSGDVPTEADKNADPSRFSGNGVLTHRIDSAKTYLELYGNGSSDCSVGEGGLTLEQATAFMDAYRNVDDEEVRGYPGMSYFYSGDGDIADCPGKPNCTAFSTYFVSKYTSMVADANGSGAVKVDRLLAINPGAQSGPTPKVFAVFQDGINHTGIILGISGDKAIIGEANCGQSDAGIKVREVSVESISGNDYKYMYTDGAVKQDIITGDIGG